MQARTAHNARRLAKLTKQQEAEEQIEREDQIRRQAAKEAKRSAERQAMEQRAAKDAAEAQEADRKKKQEDRKAITARNAPKKEVLPVTPLEMRSYAARPLQAEPANAIQPGHEASAHAQALHNFRVQQQRVESLHKQAEAQAGVFAALTGAYNPADEALRLIDEKLQVYQTQVRQQIVKRYGHLGSLALQADSFEQDIRSRVLLH